MEGGCPAKSQLSEKIVRQLLQYVLLTRLNNLFFFQMAPSLNIMFAHFEALDF